MNYSFLVTLILIQIIFQDYLYAEKVLPVFSAWTINLSLREDDFDSCGNINPLEDFIKLSLEKKSSPNDLNINSSTPYALIDADRDNAMIQFMNNKFISRETKIDTLWKKAQQAADSDEFGYMIDTLSSLSPPPLEKMADYIKFYESISDTEKKKKLIALIGECASKSSQNSNTLKDNQNIKEATSFILYLLKNENDEKVISRLGWSAMEVLPATPETYSLIINARQKRLFAYNKSDPFSKQNQSEDHLFDLSMALSNTHMQNYLIPELIKNASQSKDHSIFDTKLIVLLNLMEPENISDKIRIILKRYLSNIKVDHINYFKIDLIKAIVIVSTFKNSEKEINLLKFIMAIKNPMEKAELMFSLEDQTLDLLSKKDLRELLIEYRKLINYSETTWDQDMYRRAYR